MHVRLSLRKRFLLSFWMVLMLALVLPSFYYNRSLKEDILAESKTRAIQQLNLLQWIMTYQQGFRDAEELQAWLVQTGKRLGARITYIAEGGRVIADSEVAFAEIPSLENHSNRPEIIGARSQEIGTSTRYSSTVRQNLLYVAKSVSRQGGTPPGVLRLALPFSEVQKRVEYLNRIFMMLVLLTFVASSFLIYGLTRHLDRSVQTVIRAAKAIGTGDFKQRIHFDPGHEYFPLAHAIHQMAERLDAYVQTVSGQKQQLAAILDGMQEGVMLLDSRGRIHAVNRAMKQMAPVIPQIVGRRPLEVVRSTELQEACDRILSRMKEPHEEPVKSERIEVPLERDRTYEVNIVPMGSEKRDHGAIVVFHDISERKRLEKVHRDLHDNVSIELMSPSGTPPSRHDPVSSDS